MADPRRDTPADAEGNSTWTAARNAVGDSVEVASGAVSEYLLPSGTLKVTSHSEQIVSRARWLVFLVYCVLTAAFCYLVFWIFFSGRIEVWNALYKVDRIEAPSLVICPFRAGGRLQEVSQPSVSVVFFSDNQPTPLSVVPRECTFDGECVCVDLFGAKDPVEPLRSPQFRDHVDVSAFLGHDQPEAEFHDRVEVRTTLQDASPERTIKFGFYDSTDRTPHWVYTHLGSSCIGQLLLDQWFVINLSFQALVQFCHGDLTAMSRSRHIFRYFSQEIRHEADTEADAGARDPRETRISYEMQTFFVHWIYASETALSLYSVLVFFLLFALRGPIVHMFFDAAFPIIKVDEEPPREMHWVAQKFMHFVCCGFWPCWRSREQQPLLSSRSDS